MKLPIQLFWKLFFLVTTMVALLTFLSLNFLYAQNFEGGYDLSGGEGDEGNFFLQQAVANENSLKTKAEQFNGARSGVYDGSKLSCPYAFERDLFVGTTGEDVRLLQVLLNSDRRTLISVSGPGSLGQESDSFGEATKEAVKKFQALFIEYTGVANGRFGPRTRTVMNAICNGENKPSNSDTIDARQNRNIYENVFSVQSGAVPGGIAVTNTTGDSIAPRVSLSANVSLVKAGETFKVMINASEEIVPITPDSLIIEGGTVKEIRKLSKTSYTATIIINEEEAAKKVLVQVEADKIEDLSGNKNENASNEITVKVLAKVIEVATSNNTSSSGPSSSSSADNTDVSINSILDKIISSAQTCTYNGSGVLITVSSDGKQLNTSGCAQSQSQNLAGSNTNTYNCNGQQIPVTQPCQNQQTQTVCTTSINPVTGFPQQQCQQMTPQQAAAQQAAAQQAQQNQDFGRILGSLLRNQGYGQGQNGQGNPGANNNFNPGGSPGFTPSGAVPGGLPNVAPGADPKTASAAANSDISRDEAKIRVLEEELKNPKTTAERKKEITDELKDLKQNVKEKREELKAVQEYDTLRSEEAILEKKYSDCNANKGDDPKCQELKKEWENKKNELQEKKNELAESKCSSAEDKKANSALCDKLEKDEETEKQFNTKNGPLEKMDAGKLICFKNKCEVGDWKSTTGSHLYRSGKQALLTKVASKEGHSAIFSKNDAPYKNSVFNVCTTANKIKCTSGEDRSQTYKLDIFETVANIGNRGFSEKINAPSSASENSGNVMPPLSEYLRAR